MRLLRKRKILLNETKKREVRTTERFQKNIFRILLVITCLLVVCAVALTSYSFARYVNMLEEIKDSNVAGISCSFKVDGADEAFINAPFLQRVSENAEAVQMNTYNESVITVKNASGPSSRDYRYSFIMYIPDRCAENMMFQFVELDGNALSSDAVKASELYQIDAASPNGIRDAQIDDIGGQQVPNDYRLLIDSEGGKLDISMHAEKEDAARKSILYSTYTSYRTDYYGDTAVESLACSITSNREYEFNYYKLTVNLPVTDEYILGKGSEKSFLFRCVPTAALASSEFEQNIWDASLYGKDVAPTVPDGFLCRWTADGNGLQASQDNGLNWFDIKPKDCIGLSSPSRINVVFTQHS